jgi:16S rRNA (uracil1498-N3)-methyltransferase
MADSDDRSASSVDLPRLFIAADSLRSGRLILGAEDAGRIHRLSIGPGGKFIALDNSGWAFTVQIERANPEHAEGRILARRLVDEPRTKVSLYQGMLHPSDFRRLLREATRLGAVGFIPLITQGSVLPVLGQDGLPEGEREWPRLVRDVAESSGRGFKPSVETPMLIDQALDRAAGSGIPLLVHPSGEKVEKVLESRPFSIGLFLPPPSGFTDDELARADSRGVMRVAPPEGGPNPVRPAVSLMERVYALLEEPSEGA